MITLVMAPSHVHNHGVIIITLVKDLVGGKTHAMVSVEVS